MRLVKIGLASVNTTVGALARNVDKALEVARRMAAEDVTVGVFQEQLIGGYPPEDLVQCQGFVERQWPQLERFAQETAALRTVFVLGVAVLHQGLRYNCAALVAGGKVLGNVRHPLSASDFSSFLLQAQGSGAKVIGLANAGADTVNSIKQAA